MAGSSAQISRMLTLVAAELAGTKSGVQGELADLGRELQAQSMAAARATAEAPPQTPADAAMAERALFARAVASVRAHGGRINVLLDDYDTVCHRAGTLRIRIRRAVRPGVSIRRPARRFSSAER